MNKRLLTRKERRMYESLLNISQSTLKRVMEKFLRGNYANVYVDDSAIYAVGDIPVALVAHLDTVFRYGEREVYYDKEKNVMFSPSGLGADDRTGVFGIIKLVEDGYRPSVILTTDEEKGCKGATDFIGKVRVPLSQLNYLIQLDRHGVDDCVFYDCANPDFTKYVEGFGFHTAFGSFSDISALGPAWGIAAVNLSVGYENEHSFAEIQDFNVLFQTLDKVSKMLSQETIPAFEYISAIRNYGWFSPKAADGDKCECCGKSKQARELDTILNVNNEPQTWCYDCIDGRCGYCERCQNFFELTDDIVDMCPMCRQELYGIN